MVDRMPNILKVWLKFAKMNVQSYMEYRADFIVGVLFMTLSNLVPVIFFWVIYGFIHQMNGWTFNQVMFMLGLNYLAIGIWHTFLTGMSPRTIERMIQHGNFDRVLLQPIGSFKYMSFNRALDANGIGDFAAGILVMAYASSSLSIVWSIQNMLMLSMFVLGGVLVFFSLTIIVSVVSFIAVKSTALWDIVWDIERFIEYPLDIFNPIIIFFLTFIFPLGFINYYPAQAFLGQGIWMQAAYLTPVVGIASFVVAYLAWKAGLKHYSSTGS